MDMLSEPHHQEEPMKQYLLSVYMVEGAPVPADDEIQRM